MSDNSSNNKRIAVNTVLLYIRMVIIMFIGLYTSRIVLDALGVEDYGIYNLVGGFVTMFSVVRAGLVSSTHRFLAFDLGKRDVVNLNKTFSTLIIIYIVLCFIIFLLSETIGTWFIETKMSIPHNRLQAAHWVFQTSLVSLVITLLCSPYNSLIIAYEKMGVFAYLTIYEVIAKLIVAYMIYLSQGDKLITYSILLCIFQVSVPFFYWLYCKRCFIETNILWKIDKAKIKEIYAFAGWSMLGGVANMGFTQGLNILLGMFFSPLVNAARGVAVQVQSAVLLFLRNFQMAIDPQIIKSYARNDIVYMIKLIHVSARFSYILLLVLSLPLIFEADYVLSIWLVEVPKYTSLFFKLIIITTMYEAISNPYTKAVHATGNIKLYEICTSGVLLLIVPISYVVLKLGGAPYSVFIVHIVLGAFTMIARIELANNIAKIPISIFTRKIVPSIIIVTIISIIITMTPSIFMEENFYRFIIRFLLSTLSILISTMFFAVSSDERSYIIKTIKSKMKKNHEI